MVWKLQSEIRCYLRENPDGATRTQIAKATGIHLASVGKSLNSMPDVYIDRWEQNPGCRDQPVYVAVPVPQDCPQPSPRSK